ncbi:hypothetical protein V8E54_007103 [Elaphomyces granulatus]
MKPTILINVITAFGLMSLTSAARLSQAEAETICGDLGVMDTTNLPEGVDPNAVRTCKEHPEGAGKSLESRSCWFKSNLGCSNGGYCYKSCAQPGSGEWCWTAANNGFGNWIICKSVSDCSPSDQCGAGGCSACGCSC